MAVDQERILGPMVGLCFDNDVLDVLVVMGYAVDKLEVE